MNAPIFIHMYIFNIIHTHIKYMYLHVYMYMTKTKICMNMNMIHDFYLRISIFFFYSYIYLRCVPASSIASRLSVDPCVCTHMYIYGYTTHIYIHQYTCVCTCVVSGEQTERVLRVDGLCEISDVYCCVWECLEKIGRLLWNGLQCVAVCCRVL